MKNNDTAAIHNEISSLPIVRIDALDELFIQPLREFFLMNGCEVHINSSPSQTCTYHLIVGDMEFVKAILEKEHITNQKSMAVIWGVNEKDVMLPIRYEIKIALIDPKSLTGELLGALCNFFFTGTQHIKNFQTMPPPRMVQAPQTKPIEERPKQRETEHSKQVNEKEDRQRIAKTISQEFTIQPPKEPQKKSKIQSQKYPNQWVILSVMLIGFSLLLPIVMYVGSLILLATSLYRQSLCIKNTSCAFKTNTHANQWLRTARDSFSLIQIPLRIARQSDFIAQNENVISVFEKMTAVLASSAEINLIATDFISSFLTNDLSKQDAVSTVVQVEQMKTQIFSLHTNLDLSYRMLEQLTKDQPFPLSISFVSDKLRKGMTTLLRVRTNIQTAERLLMLYPYISGYKRPLTLLVLLQNNTELRPTGGFIGSLMYVTIEDGAISNMRVEDVYSVDGQLKGHVDPPAPIRDVLTQEHWYLRDSNWNPDFTESAKRAMWFYEKETGTIVDGVVALNASLIVNLLKLTGPVKLIDGGDEIQESNFYTKSFQYTQTDFFPGSTQKKDFLGSLMNTLTTTIFQAKKVSGVLLFETVDQALRERNVQMFFTDPEAQQLIEQFEWAGKLPTKNMCDSIVKTACVFQYYGAIEANLGVNKANYFVTRNDTRNIHVNTNGQITETITRTIINTSNQQPGSGAYKNYMRFYLPKSARVTAFTINNMSVPAKGTGKTALLLPYGELDASTSPTTTTVAAALEVLPLQEAVVSLTYEYFYQPITTDREFIMAVFTQKQSGIETIPTMIRVHYPNVWKVKGDDQTDVSTLANNGYLEYNSTMLQDSSIQIYFKKE